MTEISVVSVEPVVRIYPSMALKKANTIIYILDDYTYSCSTSTGIINRIQRLITDIEDIKKIDTYAICDHCVLGGIKCKRCEYVYGRLTTDQKLLLNERCQRLKCWVNKTKNLLECIMNSERVCQSAPHRETYDAAEYENLLQELNTPLCQRRVGETCRSEHRLTWCKNMLRELIIFLKITAAKKLVSFDESRDEVSKIKLDTSLASAGHVFDVIEPLRQSQKDNYPTAKVIDEELNKRAKEKSMLMSNRLTNKSQVMKEEKLKAKLSTKVNIKLGQVKGVHKEEKVAKKLNPSLITSKSGSANEQVVSKKKKSKWRSTLARSEGNVVKGSRKQFQDDKLTKKADSTFLSTSIATTEDPTVTDRDMKVKKIHGTEKQLPRKGSIFYQLSDRKFIEMGWTQMPTVKVMRRMNVYKMEPTSPGWFDQNKEGTTLSYNTGEILTSVIDGHGKWYYKNGTVALEYYNDEDEGKERWVMKPYMIYSYEEDPAKPQTVLACFDHLGNGIVYDSEGRERLKYNQSEGSVIDPKLGAPSNWKWHILNEPPMLLNAFVDTHPKCPSPELEVIMKQYRTETNSNDYEDLMISIELEKYAKKGVARKREYKPFKIKMKAVKINDYFSLRLFEQGHIYLQFRHDERYFKLNLGMKLHNDDIIASIVVDAFRVVTPYTKVTSASCSSRNMNKTQETLEADEATNDKNRMFDLKRQFHNVFNSVPSASPFRVIHLW